MPNKCEDAGLKHAWEKQDYMWGFEMQQKQTCGNCGLSRERHSRTEEWLSYSDGRPNEPIINIRAV